MAVFISSSPNHPVPSSPCNSYGEYCSCRLLRTSLMLTCNHAAVSSSLSPQALATLHHLLQLHVASWQQQEDERRRKEAEKESLYKYKTHGDSLTEEQRDQRDIQKYFPTYDQVMNSFRLYICTAALDCPGRPTNAA